jgi:hypothetical protein
MSRVPVACAYEVRMAAFLADQVSTTSMTPGSLFSCDSSRLGRMRRPRVMIVQEDRERVRDDAVVHRSGCTGARR